MLKLHNGGQVGNECTTKIQGNIRTKIKNKKYQILF